MRNKNIQTVWKMESNLRIRSAELTRHMKNKKMEIGNGK